MTDFEYNAQKTPLAKLEHDRLDDRTYPELQQDHSCMFLEGPPLSPPPRCHVARWVSLPEDNPLLCKCNPLPRSIIILEDRIERLNDSFIATLTRGIRLQQGVTELGMA